MTYKRRQELNEKSRLAFGASSRWHTILQKGRVVKGKTIWLNEREVEILMDEIIKQKEEINVRLRTKNTNEEKGNNSSDQERNGTEVRSGQTDDESTTSGGD